MDDAWKSKLRRALSPEIKQLQRALDAHTDRYVRYGDPEDQVEADFLRRRITALKQEVLRAEELQRSEPKPHSEHPDK